MPATVQAYLSKTSQNIIIMSITMEAAAALTLRSRCYCAAIAPAHGAHRRASATVPRRTPCRRLRALPPELSEILSPKLVPGSPADTGDVSSLIPISALMLFFYFVSNWVVPEMLMKGLKQQPKPEEDEDAAAVAASEASMSPQQQQGDIVHGQTDITGSSRGKIRLKVKTKKSRKADMKV